MEDFSYRQEPSLPLVNEEPALPLVALSEDERDEASLAETYLEGALAVGEVPVSDINDVLLIIIPPEFIDAANELAAWKIKKGIQTLVYTTDDIADVQGGHTAENIKAFIQNAYDSWQAPPTHLLIIGDAEFVPCHYKTVHQYTGTPQGMIGTDLYYTTMDGDDDTFPDIIKGRLSVDTQQQAKKRVKDIIAYERTPVSNNVFYRNATLISSFESTEYGDETLGSIKPMEDAAIFLSNPFYLGDYGVDRIYSSSFDDPQRWDLRADVGPSGGPGDFIPAYLRKPGFLWDGNRDAITAGINAGRFLAIYSGHGSTSSITFQLNIYK